MRLLGITFALLIAPLVTSTPTRAGIFDFSLIDPSLLNGYLPQGVADEAIKMYGIYAAHRPYVGATPITNYNGFDLKVEVTLMKVGDGLVNALREVGATNALPSNMPAIPMVKLNARKAIGPNSDIGFSGMVVYGQTVLGGDILILVSEAEEGEGMNVALRLGYNYLNAPYAYVKSCNTIQPELVFSRPLEFAEPYIGIGGRYMWGTIDIPLDTTPQVHLTKSGSGKDGYLFTGVSFHVIGPQGLRMGIEGSYDFSGYHTIGTVFGLGF
ncbi:MAG: hypothetical protein JST80_02460 [Bdellovibrionales bacterium]|nr:hypothetical protein [Bdellovibrionales bacterium]